MEDKTLSSAFIRISSGDPVQIAGALIGTGTAIRRVAFARDSPQRSVEPEWGGLRQWRTLTPVYTTQTKYGGGRIESRVVFPKVPGRYNPDVRTVSCEPRPPGSGIFSKNELNRQDVKSTKKTEK